MTLARPQSYRQSGGSPLTNKGHPPRVFGGHIGNGRASSLALCSNGILYAAMDRGFERLDGRDGYVALLPS